MKRLSESLQDMAGHVKQFEDSAASTAAANRAELERRRHEIDEALENDRNQFEAAVQEAAAAIRKPWVEARDSISRQLDDTRSRYEERKAEREVKRALRAADAAEEEAAEAVAVAAYCLNVAEYAVIDAALARMIADDLSSEKKPASSGAGS
jgi:hypothetical protein